MRKILIFLLYLFISSFITFPLIFNLNKILIGWPLDAYNYLWNIDTFWKQVLSLQNPFFTDRIFYPIGTYLIFHTYSPFVSLLGFLFIKNVPLYLNLLVLMGPVFSAFTTYLLVRHFTKRDFPSVLSGIVYGFSPIMISFLISQHYYYLFTAPLIPLGVLLLVKFLETGGTKDLIKLIVLFWICVGFDYYTSIIFLMLAIPFFTIYVILNFKAVLENFKQNTKPILIAISTLLIVPGILIYLLLKNNGTGQNYLTQKSYYPQICSARMERLITPSQWNPFLKNVGLNLEKKYFLSKNYDTPSIFLGFTIPIVGLLSIFLLSTKKALPIFGVGIFILLFSLGPTSKFFELITRIPLLGLIDCPQRFILGAQLALSVLIGLTLSQVNKTKLGKFILIIVGILIIIEYTSWKLPYSKIEVPELYKVLSQNSSNKTILELPSGIAESKGAFGYDWSIQGLLLKQMYWQTIHGKNRVGGYTSRLDRSYYTFFENEPIISDLFKMTSLNGFWEGESFTNQEVSMFMDKFNLGFIILSPNSRQIEFSKVVENTFGKRISEKKEAEGFILYTLN